jgi:hypothetical protein
MKIREFSALTATLDLDPTDCITLADACAVSLKHDEALDRNLVGALRAALEACAVIAATDTLRDNKVQEAGMLDDTRRVWAPRDASIGGQPRLWERPA